MSNFAQDMAVKTAWGLSLTQWDRATETQRRHWRDMVTTAPHFNQD
ncbi:hypothetical protein SRABI83_03241 [Arthrobacter sp. Bi83]|nr:hypothetical protein [Arthrobacter sp. Bi83]CAH0255834.1 hypothetical protein SRABI83_03241 [Arthrobacter sp. Bi83]